MTYGYVRVSSLTQNIDRQMEEMYKQGLNDDQIYVDKQSGKDFEREQYQLLLHRLRKGDLLIIKSIDRLGRNYKMIMEEWYIITKQMEVDIFVLDMPLLDTRLRGENLVGRFISDIVLQILSFVAENERDNIRARQAEGIRIAREKGKHLGRPRYSLPENFEHITKQFLRKEITNKEAMVLLQMTKGTFYKYIKTVSL